MFAWLIDRIRALKPVKLASTREATADNSHNLRSESIDKYRQKFAIAPFGYWHQAVGTFGAICDEAWEFQLDRTGRFISHSAFSGKREILFEWKEVAELTIACRVTQWLEEEDNELEDSEDLAFEREVSEEWQTIRYDFKTVPTDVGELIGMYEVRDDNIIHQGFWYSLEPLSFAKGL